MPPTNKQTGAVVKAADALLRTVKVQHEDPDIADAVAVRLDALFVALTNCPGTWCQQHGDEEVQSTETGEAAEARRAIESPN